MTKIAGRQIESPLRSVVKASTWRVIASLDTMIIVWFVTGEITAAVFTGGIEVVTKFILYILHERGWALVPLGTLSGIANRFKPGS